MTADKFKSVLITFPVHFPYFLYDNSQLTIELLFKMFLNKMQIYLRLGINNYTHTVNY
jgi:hypothetical protein